MLSREYGISQAAIINYLIEYGDAWKLAQEIEKHNGLFGEDIISACVINNKIVVLEGNRRIAACKFLLDNSILSKSLSSRYPKIVPSKETLKNIQRILLLIYDNSSDEQTYIASKHTQPNIKKWSTIEQYNYYYSQFNKGKTAQQIAIAVQVATASEVAKRIRQYKLFFKIFNLVKEKHPNLQVEASSILPVAAAFMPKLLNEKNKYTLLGVTSDPDTLTYVPLSVQENLYDEILCLIGEAFLVRLEAKKQVEIAARPHSAMFRISSDEIKSSKKVEALIDDDVRIPGLKSLILKFRGKDYDSDHAENNGGDTAHHQHETKTNSNLDSSYSEDGAPTEKPNGGTDNNSGPKGQPYFSQAKTDGSAKKDDSAKTQALFATQEKECRFFADFRFEHLSPKNDYNKGIIAVAKEITSLSKANRYTGYYDFPLAASFLLRSLIEQTLLRQLRGTNAYKRLSKSSSKPTPELGIIVQEILKSCHNGNYQDVNFDKLLGNDFIACFDGAGTKLQLNKIIHSPAECQPNREFLDSMATGGLKNLLQKLVDSFV